MLWRDFFLLRSITDDKLQWLDYGDAIHPGH